jgi:hypothetical protein
MLLLEATAVAWLCVLWWFQGKEVFCFVKTLEPDWTIKACSKSCAGGAMDQLQALASVPFLAEAG